MKLVEELLAGPRFENAIFLTYNLDLAWFEALIHRQLRQRGLRRCLVLADEGQLSSTLDGQGAILKGAGLSYLVQPVRVAGAFHPKAILLTNNETARLYVGSGNLTSQGYGQNLEVFSRWEVNSNVRRVPRAFEEFRRYIVDTLLPLLDGGSQLMREQVQEAFGVRCLTRSLASSDGAELWGSPGALMSRLEPRSAARAVVLAPYFDAQGEFVRQLSERWSLDSLEVVTDTRSTNLTGQALAALEEAGAKVFALESPRRLHAKVLYVESQEGTLGIAGSANLSMAAWRGYNAELVVAREGEAAADIHALLEVLSWTPLDEEQRKVIEEREDTTPSPGDESEEHSRLPRLFFAMWSGPTTVRLAWDGPFSDDVEFELRLPGEFHRGERAQVAGEAACYVDFGTVRSRELPAQLRISIGEASGPWLTVHDVAALSERARPIGAAGARLTELLADPDFDPAGLEKLLKLLGDVAKKQQKQKQREREEAPPDAVDLDVGWVQIDEGQFTTTDNVLGTASSYRHLTGLSPGLIRGLLFGDDSGVDVDASEGESEESYVEQAIVEREDRDVRFRPATFRQARFSATIGTVSALYLEQFTSDDAPTRSAARLLEDLAVLAGLLHYSVQGEACAVRDFRFELIQLMRAFVGWRSSPLTSALRRLSPEERFDLLERESVLLLLGLLLYNACLVDVECEVDAVRSDFFCHHPELWMRNVVREVGVVSAAAVLESFDRRQGALRTGILWLSSMLPQSATLLPFKE